MNRERLLALADHLEQVSDDRFNLNTWSSTTRDNLDEFIERDADGNIIGYKRAACGFSACAMGHAIAVPMLREAGLKLIIEKGSNVAVVAMASGGYGYSAAMDLFDIDVDTAYALFAPDYYPPTDRRNPQAVAARIRQVAAGKFNPDEAEQYAL